MVTTVLVLLVSQVLGASWDDIQTSWRARQENTTSLRFKWDTVEFNAPGSQPAFRESSQYPPKAVTFKSDSSYSISENNHIRIDYNGYQWSHFDDSGNVPKQTTLMVKDGTYDVLDICSGWRTHPILFREEGDVSSIRNEGSIVVLDWIYRPLDTDAIREGQPAVLEDTIVNGIRCVGLAVAQSSPPIKDTLWLDPKRGYLPVKMTRVVRRRRAREISIKYSSSDGGDWLPKEWTVTHLEKNGRLKRSLGARVTLASVNRPVSDDVFELDLPSDIWIQDSRNGDKPQDYILREDGSRREILDGEFNGTNYEAIVRSESGDLLPRWPIWFVVVNIIAASALLLVGARAAMLRRVR